MQERGVRPDGDVMTLIQGLCNAAEVDGAVELLNEMCGSGIEPNVVVYSCLLPGYFKSSRWQDVGEGNKSLYLWSLWSCTCTPVWGCNISFSAARTSTIAALEDSILDCFSI